MLLTQLCELLLKLFQLGFHDGADVTLVGIVVGKVLMVFLSGIEFRRCRDLGDNGTGELFLVIFFGLFGERFLFLVSVKDARAILRAMVVALIVQCGGIMSIPEKLHEILVADDGGIKNDLYRFSMTGGSGANLFVSGIIHLATDIATGDGGDAFHDQVTTFRAPETTSGENGFFSFLCRRFYSRQSKSAHKGQEEDGFHREGWFDIYTSLDVRISSQNLFI